MNIVFLDESTVTLEDVDFSPFQRLGSYEGYPNSDEDQTIERAKEADAIIVNKVLVTAKVLENLPGLKLVTVIATGYNNVDTAAAEQRGVSVCNVAGYAADSVPQHTFALILNLATKAYRYNDDIRAGQWERASSFTLLSYPTFELAGKTIGIIGFGTIGCNVAKIAEAFGMKVLASDPFGIRGGAYPNTDIGTLFAESDVVTLHCPLTDDNRNLIDAAALAKMKPTAILINTARGGLVDEQALFEALESGGIGGAGVDVLSKEPPKGGNVLLGAPNIIITPHCAWSMFEARQRLIDETAENIRAFFAGNPRNLVTKTK